MLPEAELRAVLSALPLIDVTGPWTRVIGYHLLQGPPPGGSPGDPPQPLWPGGPGLRGARFTPKGGFGSIYLASDPVTALGEVGAIFENPAAPPANFRTPPWTVFTVEGVIERALDLTDQRNMDRLGTSLSELTGDWRYPQALFLRGSGPIPPTQLLGKIAFEATGVSAIQYHSAKKPGGGLGIVVFADRLASGGSGFLQVYDPQGLIRQRLP